MQVETGDILDGFTIEQQLHKGAAAHLYRAVDSLDPDRSVVLKIPHDNILNQPALFYHFQNEEYISRYLNHPGVVHFLARQTSRQYLVQEYIEGIDLKSLLQKEKKLDCDRALDICRKVCEPLRYLHTRSIIHLDLKPENIMIMPNGGIKIIDFGLAHHIGLHDFLGDDFQEPHGTPYYISPEQLCGRRDQPQSDIYSLGIILYEMITGELPFEKSDKLSVVKLRLNKKPIPPRYFNNNLSPVIQQILLKMLEADLQNRYGSVEELQHDLNNMNDIEITEKGLAAEKPGRLLAMLTPADCGRYESEIIGNDLTVPIGARQILGCIIDDDIAQFVVEEVKREALTRGGNITLLLVVEDEIESVEVEHQNEILGSRLAKRVDSYISYLKKYQLSVTLRVKKGNPADEIVSMAQKIGADLTILGPPRMQTGFAAFLHFFGGTTIAKVVRLLDSPLRILEPASAGPGPKIKRQGILAEPHKNSVTIFLADIWVYHLNCLIQAVDSHHGGTIPSAESCPAGKWLKQNNRQFGDLEKGMELAATHDELHHVIDEIIRLRVSNSDFRDAYRTKALPLADQFMKQLQEAGAAFMKKNGDEWVKV